MRFARLTGPGRREGAHRPDIQSVDEPPGKPAAPSVAPTANSTTSLDVNWSAPSNTGPAIDNYDLRYRAGTAGNWTPGPQDVTTTAGSIPRLQAGTSYQVQVRASNAEGDGAWSDPGSATTSTPANSTPAFDAASYTFDLAENADGSITPVALGSVSATDADASDTVRYSITGGNTGGVFAIGASTGAITYTGSGENYEGFANPGSAFSLTVRASDGTAHSEVTVTVAVTDVDEPSFGAVPNPDQTEPLTLPPAPVKLQVGSMARVGEKETRLSHRIKLTERPSGMVCNMAAGVARDPMPA